MTTFHNTSTTLQQIIGGTKKAVRKLLLDAIEEEHIWPGFQPIIDIRSGKVAGFEILARWSVPNEGDLSPDVFISSLERLGLIDLLMDALIERACREALLLPGDFFIAFNISPAQLSCSTLPQHIQDLVARTGFPTARVHVEITETSIFKDAESAYSVLRQLDDIGMHIAIDDFGTGYSNLARLESFPFYKIKIDKQFVHRIDKDMAKRRIAAAIIGLGQSLGIIVVAEGVETKEEEAILRGFGCDLGQGWLYAKALKIDAARQFLEIFGDIGAQSLALDVSHFLRTHQLETIYKKSPLGMCLVDLSFRHASVNEHFASIHCMTAQELEGKTIYEVMDNETAMIVEEKLKTCRDLGTPVQHQYYLFGRHIMVFTSCIFDTDETPLGYSVVAIDNSEQVKTLQYISEREEHYNSISQFTPDVEWSANPDGTFDYISPMSDGVLGGTMRERIERWLSRIHPEDFPEIQKKWFTEIKLVDVYESEFRVQKQDGSYGRVRGCAVAARGADGQIKKWYGLTKWL